MESIYADIAARTGGNVYIGVVGPVRTGKSTLIKRIMETLVIPAIGDPYRAQRARDELPQSASGRTIMTAEPKFVPEEAVEITPDGKTNLRLRMIDSVGYMIPGAVGADEEGVPRMVSTPWQETPIPMTEAAELGTKKVMEDHCSIGLVVTTDGSVTDIPRGDYVEAEGRAIRDMQATGKPFLVVVNTRNPGSEESGAVQNELRSRYGVESVAADCQALTKEGIAQLLEQLLYSFPLRQVLVYLPRWLDALEADHPLKAALYPALQKKAAEIASLAQAEGTLGKLRELEDVVDMVIRSVDLGSGTVACQITLKDSLFYEILSSRAGQSIENDGQLLQLLTELAGVKAEYDKISDAMAAVQATGYGIVMPTAKDTVLEQPEVVKKGGAYGVKLKAQAPSIHMIRVDVGTEISPMVGGEQQSMDLIGYLSGEDPEKLWESNIFGKSVGAMIQEGLTGKLLRTPEDVRAKFRGTLTRVINEGANGLICLIL
ncbi:MAG: stage IV sporulation protein A [Oscillospiraceae bacterium]|nr:stage IV sporulation protein A [Oscillospiraceae bacterium]